MPTAEYLVKELDSLPPRYREEALDFIDYLKQKAAASHAVVPVPKETASPEVSEEGDRLEVIPAWKLFGRPRPPTPEETDAAIKEGYGIAKRMGTTLTVDKFLQWKQEDIALEETQYRERFHKDGVK
jgi:sulfur carrier protein ThiS